jgi:hypothetical protein
MIEFDIKDEEVKNIRIFKNTFYSSLKLINPLEEEPLFQITDDDKLILHAYGSTASGKYAGAKITLPILSVKKDPGLAWFTFALEDFFRGIDLYSNIDTYHIKIDTNLNIINISDPSNPYVSETDSKNSEILYVNKIYTTEEAEECINDMKSCLENPKLEKKGVIHFTDYLLSILTNLSVSLKIGESTDAFLIGKDFVKTSDSASVISVNAKETFLLEDPTGKGIELDLSALSLLKNILPSGEFDINIYTDSGLASISHITIPSIGVEIMWTNKSFNLDFPSEDEYATVLPSKEKTIIEFNIKDLLEAISSFKNYFPAVDWKWGQVNFEFDDSLPTVTFSYKTTKYDYKLNKNRTLISNSDPNKKYSFYLPSYYIKSLLDIEGPYKDEEKKDLNKITFEFNSIGAREPHGQAILVKTDSIIAAICKLIK